MDCPYRSIRMPLVRAAPGGRSAAQPRVRRDLTEQKPVETASPVSPANTSDEYVLVFRSDFEQQGGNMNEVNGDMRVRCRATPSVTLFFPLRFRHCMPVPVSKCSLYNLFYLSFLCCPALWVACPQLLCVWSLVRVTGIWGKGLSLWILNTSWARCTCKITASLCIFRRLSAVVTHSVTGFLQKQNHTCEVRQSWKPIQETLFFGDTTSVDNVVSRTDSR